MAVAGLACVAASFGGIAHAVLLYSTSGASLSIFDSTAPGVVTTLPVTGMQPSETLVGIDVRPANSMLYGVGSANRLYTINPVTGAATLVGNPNGFTLAGTAWGTDFNPVPDRLRQVSNTEQNLRINPNDATSITDLALNPAGNIVSVAYSNNFPGATSTTLFAIDSNLGTLNIVSNPNGGGPIMTVGSLGVGSGLFEFIGFDIVGTENTGFASITTTAAGTHLYSINLTTGAATDLGAIGTGMNPQLGLTAATIIPEPAAGLLLLGMAGLFSLRRRRT